MKASIRAKVDHPFRIIKRQFGFVKARYKGLLKNDNQLAMLFTLANLFRVDQMGNDSNLLIVFYVQIMPDDFVMQLHRF